MTTMQEIIDAEMEIPDGILAIKANEKDIFKWVTIPGRGHINIGGPGVTERIEDRQIPALKTATGKEREKLLTLRTAVIESRKFYTNPIDKNRASSNEALNNARKAGASEKEIDSIKTSFGKGCKIYDGNKISHSIWETTPKKVVSENPKKVKVIITKNKPKISDENKITPRYQGLVERQFHDAEDPSGKFHYYQAGLLDIYVEQGQNHKKAVDNVLEVYQRVPQKDRDISFTVIGYNNHKYGSGSISHAAGSANYESKRICIYDTNIDKTIGKGTLLHEIGHLSVRDRTYKPQGFEEALIKDSKDITSYGTKNNPREAYAESYAKYFSNGKVTGDRSVKELPNVTNFMRERYGDAPDTSPTKGWHLRFSENKSSAKIEDYIKDTLGLDWEIYEDKDQVILSGFKDKVFVEEIFINKG